MFELMDKKIILIFKMFACLDLLIQEVFHVYLNKFENAVTHLFLVTFGNN